MPSSGETLGADLFDLWDTGNRDLPEVANLYKSAKEKLRETDKAEKELFTDGDGGLNEVWQYLESLQTGLWNLLNEGEADMRAVGVALLQLVDDYREVDCEAAAKLDSLIEEAEEG